MHYPCTICIVCGTGAYASARNSTVLWHDKGKSAIRVGGWHTWAQRRQCTVYMHVSMHVYKCLCRHTWAQRRQCTLPHLRLTQCMHPSTMVPATCYLLPICSQRTNASSPMPCACVVQVPNVTLRCSTTPSTHYTSCTGT